MDGVWLFCKMFLLILFVGTFICIVMSAIIAEDYQDYRKKKELNKLLRGFDEDEVKFYTQIFDKIQQASDYIRCDMIEVSFDNIKISFTDTYHHCLSLEIIKDYRSDNVFIFPDDHNMEVLDFLTEYAFDKAYKLHQIMVEKNQKELIEQNKQKIKNLLSKKD